MRYFPIFINLENKPILVVGGGEVASRKVDALVRAGADVTIISPSIDPYLQTLEKNGEVHWIQNFYSQEYMDSRYIQVWATTDNPHLNHQVHADAKKLGLLVNVVDDQPYCDFITPSIVNRGRIQIAISSGGASPVLIRNLRQQLETIIPQNLALLADYGSSKRVDIKERLPSVDKRRYFWERFFDRDAVKNAKTNSELEQEYVELMSSTDASENPAEVNWLEYGDDPEMLTLKAMRLMQQAEWVFYHVDCPFSFVDLVRRDAERMPFNNEHELVELMHEAGKESRILIFTPPNDHTYKLLQQDKPLIKLGKQ